MPNRQGDVRRKPGDIAGTDVASDLCLPLHGRYSLLSFSGTSLNRFCNVYLKDVSHVKLLKSIQSLDGKKAPIIQRNEATLGTSEYHNRGKTSRSAA